MDGIIMAAQLILGLSILVGVHEMGHLLAAKYFGMRVDQFSIGFPPKIFGIKIGETEYRLGSIPVGGYVKIAGMIDESLDTQHLSAEPQPWEFRAKPPWQRLIVMMGGIVVNVITGIIIFVCLTYFIGEKYLPAGEARYGIVAHPLAEKIGLKTGDKIVGINGHSFDRFSDIYGSDVLLDSKSYYTVDRNGERLDIQIPSNLMESLSQKHGNVPFIDPAYPFAVGKVLPGSAAETAGLMDGDRIVAVDSTPVNYFHELQAALKHKAGTTADITVNRKRSIIHLNANISADGKLGFMASSLLKDASAKYSLGESVVKGTNKAFTIIWVQLKAFRKMFSGEIDVTKSISGPIGIAKEFGGTWDWERFWNLTGLLSMVLAFMNFLPIPALDGGHVMFLTYEMISRRKPSDRFLEVSQKLGMALLLALTVFTIFNDVFKLFH